MVVLYFLLYKYLFTPQGEEEIWLRVQQMMKGSDIGIQEKKDKLFNKWERGWMSSVLGSFVSMVSSIGSCSSTPGGGIGGSLSKEFEGKEEERGAFVFALESNRGHLDRSDLKHSKMYPIYVTQKNHGEEIA
nr:hypothetical protein [Tanacetum cinerariifolium]